MVDEQDVWLKFKQGSETDFAYLYRLYAPVMFRYGSKLSSDRELIKDCLQQVFFTLWKSRENLGNPASVKQYLLKALRSEIFKKTGRGLKYESISEDYHFKVVPSFETTLIEQQSVESIKQKIADLLSGLPPRQREIIFLKYYNNFSYQEIANIMGIDKDSVYKLSYKALEKIQQLFIKISAIIILLFAI